MSMSDVGIAEVRGVALTITPAMEEGRVVVQLQGNADMDGHTLLVDFLQKIHAHTKRGKTTEVVIDIRGLYFMNSSCLNALIRWINNVRSMPLDARHRITFLSNSKLPWQAKSLRSIKCFADELIVVQCAS